MFEKQDDHFRVQSHIFLPFIACRKLTSVKFAFTVKSALNFPAEACIILFRAVPHIVQIELFDIDKLPGRRIVADPADKMSAFPITKRCEDHVLCQFEFPAHACDIHLFSRMVTAKQSV